MKQNRETATLQASNKQVVRGFTEAINARNWPRLRALTAPDFVRHSYAAAETPVASQEDLLRYIQDEYVTFPDAAETVDLLVAEGDYVAAYHVFRGTQSGPMGAFPPTGKVLRSAYVAIYRILDGKIVEAWAEWDNLSGLIRLGHYRPPRKQEGAE